MPQATGRPMAATMPLATSGKQQLIRWLCGETCAAARAMREVRTAWNTAVALKPPSATRLRPGVAGAGDDGGRLQRCRLHDDGGAIGSPAARRRRRRRQGRSRACRSRPGGANMSARACAAVLIQARRRALRPAMSMRVGCVAVAARSQAMRWAKLPVPKIRMSHAVRHVLFSVAVAVVACSDLIPFSGACQRRYEERSQGTRMTSSNRRRGDHRRRPDGLLLGLFPAPARAIGRRDREGQGVRGRERRQLRQPAPAGAQSRRNFRCRCGRMRSGRTCRGSPARTAAFIAVRARVSGVCARATSRSWSAPRAMRGRQAWTWTLLDGPAARRRWPVLSEVVTGASWSKRDAIADPAVASPAVARLAVRAGAQILEHTKVVAVGASGVRLRRCDRHGPDA